MQNSPNRGSGRRRSVACGIQLVCQLDEPLITPIKVSVFSIEAHDRAMDRLVQAGAVPITSLQYLFELQQDWARSATCEGVMEILKTHTPYGVQLRFSEWALGEDASEAGMKVA